MTKTTLPISNPRLRSFGVNYWWEGDYALMWGDYGNDPYNFDKSRLRLSLQSVKTYQLSVLLLLQIHNPILHISMYVLIWNMHRKVLIRICICIPYWFLHHIIQLQFPMEECIVSFLYYYDYGSFGLVLVSYVYVLLCFFWVLSSYLYLYLYWGSWGSIK